MLNLQLFKRYKRCRNFSYRAVQKVIKSLSFVLWRVVRGCVMDPPTAILAIPRYVFSALPLLNERKEICSCHSPMSVITELPLFQIHIIPLKDSFGFHFSSVWPTDLENRITHDVFFFLVIWHALAATTTMSQPQEWTRVGSRQYAPPCHLSTSRIIITHHLRTWQIARVSVPSCSPWRFNRDSQRQLRPRQMQRMPPTVRRLIWRIHRCSLSRWNCQRWTVQGSPSTAEKWWSDIF